MTRWISAWSGGFSRLLILLLILCAPVFVQAQSAVETATFAGGCFWCTEEAFEKVEGVISVTSGFTGDADQEASSASKHQMESVEIKYDPAKVTYEQLLQIYWKNIDPSDPSGQFCDRGGQYQSAILYHNDAQKALAEKSLAEVEAKLHKKPATPILRAGKFIRADESHQDFYKKNALRYKQYKIQCQRERKLHEIWGKEN